PVRPVYDGTLAELYAIYLRHLVLMVVTLGWSRFWGRTRLRRYLWNHLSILDDRLEYRGRGLELFIGFMVVLAILLALSGIVWAAWAYWLADRMPPGIGLLNFLPLGIALIGFPLAFVGHYAGLRYKLSRTRWRGIRCGMAGSAWAFGGLATALTFANGMTGQLLLPVVSMALARPRIANARVGTQGFEFAGRAGDIYGRYIGYYFLNIAMWIVTFGVAALVIGVGVTKLSGQAKDLATIFTHPGPLAYLLILAMLFAVYVVFGLLILPVRCWWLDYLILLLSLGLGWPWVTHRTLRLIARELWIYGSPDGASIKQPADKGPGF